MAINTDIYVLWHLSPRIIVVPAPYTELTLQDLVDTCKYLEGLPANMDDDPLVEAAGKEFLGGTTYVGITATLQNAKVLFEGRSTPLIDGEQVTSNDSTGKLLVDSGGTFVTTGVIPGDTVVNATTNELGVVLEVLSETQVSHFPLSGQGGQGWTIDDYYVIYHNAQCEILGGNLVAVDSNGSYVSPVFYAPNVQIVRTASASATLQEQSLLQYASFGGVVHVDSTSGNSGTEFPIGTQETPVDNVEDAVTIATNYGFNRLRFLSDYTFGATTLVTGFELQGIGFQNTTFTFVDGCQLIGCIVKNATVTGFDIGIAGFYNCLLQNMSPSSSATGDKDAVMNGVLLEGESVIASNWTGSLETLNSFFINDPATDESFILNLNNTPSRLYYRNVSGNITIKNNTNTNCIVEIILSGGSITLDSTITAGVFIISGVGILFDNSTSTAVLKDAFISKETISQAVLNTSLVGFDVDDSVADALKYVMYQNMVVLDTVNGVAGTTFPIGTMEHPVDNLDDAITIADSMGFKQIQFLSDFTFTDDILITGYVLIGAGLQNTTFTFVDGCQLLGCQVMRAKMTGFDLGISGIGESHLFNMSPSSSAAGDKNALINRVIFEGTSVISSSWTGSLEVFDSFFRKSDAGVPFIVDINEGSTSLYYKNCYGDIIFKNNSDSGIYVEVNLNGGSITLDSTITAGTFFFSGMGKLIDNSTGTTIDSDGLIHKETISIAVWDEILNGDTHNLPSSAGRRLRQLSSNVIHEGTVESATDNTVTFNEDASTVDGAYDPAVIVITANTGIGQSRLVLEYDGSTKTAVVDRNWKQIPDDTSEFLIYGYPGREHINEGLAQGGSANKIILNALASSANDAYVGQTVFLRSGTGEDQAKQVIAYNGATKEATVASNWYIIPDMTTAYVILPFHSNLLTDVSDAVWEHSTALDVLSSIAFIENIEGGKWEISGTQMIFYKADNITEIARFDLTLDGNSNPIARDRA